VSHGNNNTAAVTVKKDKEFTTTFSRHADSPALNCYDEILTAYGFEITWQVLFT
jgi:hypothetical protein